MVTPSLKDSKSPEKIPEIIENGVNNQRVYSFSDLCYFRANSAAIANYCTLIKSNLMWERSRKAPIEGNKK